MTIKRTRYVWLIFSLLLVSCDEANVFVTFEEDGSGLINLESINYPDGEYADYESIEDCSEAFDTDGAIQPDDIAYESYSSASIGNQSGDRCIYTYEFNDLEEAEKLHAFFSIELVQLYYHGNSFTYQASNDDCDGESGAPATLNLRMPGIISSHNAEKIIGDQLTWDFSSSCYDIYAESTLAQSESESSVNESSTSEDESDNEVSPAEQPSQNSAILWAIIGAAIPTLIGIIAYLKSRKTKGTE